MRLLIALLVWAGAVAGAVELSSAVAGSIHNPRSTAAGSSAPGGGGGGGTSGGSFDASSVTATDPDSMFHTANFTRALAAARSQLGADARLDNFVIYPGYLSVTAAKSGTEVDFYIDAQGTQSTNSGGSPGATTLFPLSRVKPDVPAALARRIAIRAHVPEAQLHYMVVEIDPSTNRLRWLVYTVEGSSVEYFQAPGATGQLLAYRTNSSTGLQPVR